jgi:predicted RNA-binding Zn-ribbon protein involved in translation (DUF1610 family)
MKIVHIIRADKCPLCGSTNIYRSKRKGIAEQVACWITSVRPFRCNGCYSRIYAVRGGAKKSA